jgi:hypothetical protein
MSALAAALLASGEQNWTKEYRLEGHKTFTEVHISRHGLKVNGTFERGVYPDFANEFPDARPHLIHFSANVEDINSANTLIKNIKFTEDASKENFWVSDEGLQWIIRSGAEGEKLWITFITPKDSPPEVRALGPTFQLKVPLVNR